MNLSFRSYLYWMKILILIVTVILLLPKLFGFYYLSKGGKLLYKSLELAKISKTYSACAYSKQYRVINNSDNNSQVIFNEAIQNLKISSEFIPNNSQVQMLLETTESDSIFR
jgi:type IV secretory pathway VirB4 component